MKYRFPGVKPFCTDDKEIFFGREEDTESLSELVDVNQIVVLHSKSGLGKSSLINAGLIPKLIKNSDIEILPVRFRNFLGKGTKPLTELFIENLNVKSKTCIDKIKSDDNTLWFHFKKYQLLKKKNNYFLILDQFEEIFSYPEEQIEQLASQLADLLFTVIPQTFRKSLEMKLKENRSFLSPAERDGLFRKVKVNILFSIRSDKLSLLSKIENYLPNLLQNTYQLNALNWEQAEDAILIPASYSKRDIQFYSKPFTISDKSIFSILNYLTQKRTKPIETFQLQILCQYIENQVIERNIKEVSDNHLDNFENIYHNYYENLIKRIDKEEDRKRARHFIEEGLIFEEEERRLSLYEGQIMRDFNINRQLLNKLVNTHLIRVEPHATGDNYYEISHDTLIPPILKAKILRHRDEAKEEAIKRQNEIIAKQKKQAKFYRNIAYVVVLPLVVLCVSTLLLFNMYLGIRYDLARAETDATSLQKDTNKMQNEIQILKKSHAELLQQKEQQDIQIEHLVKTLGSYERELVVTKIKTSVDEKFQSGNYKAAVMAMESLQKFYDKIDADRTTQAIVYGHYAWYLLFTGDYSTAAFKASMGLSFDKNQTWINKNLAHANLLSGKTETAKNLYLKYKDKPYNYDGRNTTFRRIYFDDFNLMEKAGIKDNKITDMRRLLR